MSDDRHGLRKQGPAITGMPANLGFSQTGTTVGTEADPTSDTPKFNLTPETRYIELFKELNRASIHQTTF